MTDQECTVASEFAAQLSIEFRIAHSFTQLRLVQQDAARAGNFPPEYVLCDAPGLCFKKRQVVANARPKLTDVIHEFGRIAACESFPESARSFLDCRSSPPKFGPLKSSVSRQTAFINLGKTLNAARWTKPLVQTVEAAKLTSLQLQELITRTVRETKRRGIVAANSTPLALSANEKFNALGNWEPSLWNGCII
jgi:hypothetical protein